MDIDHGTAKIAQRGKSEKQAEGRRTGRNVVNLEWPGSCMNRGIEMGMRFIVGKAPEWEGWECVIN